MNTITGLENSLLPQSIKLRFSSSKTTWPQPQNSIGRFIARIDRKLCWEATGEAREAFLVLSPKIKDFLDSNTEPPSEWVTWSIYMIGVSELRAVPTIVFCCENESYRNEIRDVIRGSGVLDEHPGIALKHLPRAPDCRRLIQLASQAKLLQTEAMPQVEDRLEIPEVYSTTYDPRPGTQLYIRTSHSLAPRKATAGGTVRIGGQYFVVTAAHAFTDIYLDPSSTGGGYEDLHFSDSDEECEADCTVNDSGYLSPASLHPPDVQGCQTRDQTEHGRCAQPATEDISRIPKNAFRIGNLLFSSSESHNPDLDYALIRLSAFPSFLDISSRLLGLPRYIEKKTMNEARAHPVKAFTASTSIVYGNMSPTPEFLRLPGAKKYQLVYNVHLETALEAGDCGSWVYGATGEVYGHLVAGSPETSNALIVPAFEIFEDLQNMLSFIQARIDARYEPQAHRSTSPPRLHAFRKILQARKINAGTKSGKNRDVQLPDISRLVSARKDTATGNRPPLWSPNEDTFTNPDNPLHSGDGGSVADEDKPDHETAPTAPTSDKEST